MKAGKLTAGFCLTVLLTAAAAVTSMAAPGTSGDWRQEQDGRWYYYDEGGTMCTGWIEVGGKHYYLYEDGHCAMNEITPDGFRVDADGAWYEAKRELLGQEFPLPAGFQNSISLGDGWGGAQAALNGAAGKISADSGGKRKLLIDSTAIEYKSAVKSAKDDARYMGLYKDSTTGGYRLDIFILLDRNSETQSLGEALDYEVFKAMLTTVSSTPTSWRKLYTAAGRGTIAGTYPEPQLHLWETAA